MIRFRDEKQPRLEGFETIFERELNRENRWVKLSALVAWDELGEAYEKSLTRGMGRPAKDARLVIGAMIVKHKLKLSDEETIEQLRENPYLQYFVGFGEFQKEAPFSPTLFVEIRKRMGEEMFEEFNRTIVKRLEGDGKETDEGDKPGKGKMIVDATVAEQAIRYPTDLDLLNESRESLERMVDELAEPGAKPRTYRRKARKDYLAAVKQRRPGEKKRREGVRRQLQYVGRNIRHVDELLERGEKRLPDRLLRRFWIIREVCRQQLGMYREKTRRCDDRIVSLSQPQVRPVVRGKVSKAVEFGAKIGVSLANGIAAVDHLSWNAYNESEDLKMQVEAYRKRHGRYPEKVYADPIYGTRENRRWLKERGIEFGGKPLGRPRKESREQKERQEDYRQRIPIEGKFGQGKNRYGLDRIKAKTRKTSEAWIRSIFFVMNLVFLEKALSLLEILTAYIRRNLQTRAIRQEKSRDQKNFVRSSCFVREMAPSF